MRVMSIVGARPQFIKETIVHRAFGECGIDEIIVNTGQHYDYNMSEVFFGTLQIRMPDYDLNVGSGSHGEMTGRIMIECEKVVAQAKPDLVMVYGDTNTTLGGALVAAKMKIPVAHVEAGIRMLPKTMPEEINRVVVDSVSDHLFCASAHSVKNLARENVRGKVYFTGDVMYDLFLKMEGLFRYELFDAMKLEEGAYVVVTLHRDYNVDDRVKLSGILNALNRLSRETSVVFPVHPRTRKRIAEFGLGDAVTGLRMIDPLDYLNIMGLVRRCRMVITDSGGLQKEAYFAGKYVAIMMPDTGWVELIENGCADLYDEEDIDRCLERATRRPASVAGLYGGGDAGEKIARIIGSLG